MRASSRAVLGVATFCLALPAVPVPGRATARAEPVMRPSLARAIEDAPSGILRAFVTVRGEATLRDVASLRALGVHPLRVFDRFGAIYVEATGAALERATHLARVRALTADARLHRYGDTDTVATRARDVWDTKSTSTPMSIGSTPLDGRGIGVAVIDDGIDGAHPDLAPAMAGNMKLIEDLVTLRHGCDAPVWYDTSDSDTTSGHGTHVAGIVAGRGIRSAGRFTGAAPGASIYGLGVGEVNTVLYALEAMLWIDCNHDDVTPRIRVVNASWGADPGPFDPDDPISRATDVLVADRLVVTFAAGNDGGTGATDMINPYAQNPTQGVIGVANYDDRGNATRSGSIAPDSSRGAAGDPVWLRASSWPDVAAPGVNIVSTAARTGAYVPPGLEASYEPYYTRSSGTSMAAPQVAGIAALILEAKPSLAPWDVEQLLEDHAVAFPVAGGYVPDPSNGTTGVNYAAGHGLVDAIACLLALGVTGGSAIPQVAQHPHVYLGGSGIQADPQVADAVQWTVPHGVQIVLSEYEISTGNVVLYPLKAAQAARFRLFPPTGPSVDLVSSTIAEGGGSYHFDRAWTFAAAGTYRIESALFFNGGYRSFDSWVVRVR